MKKTKHLIMIYTSDLKKDMILGRDIHLDGIKLLSAGTPLTEGIITKIKQRFPDSKIAIIKPTIPYFEIEEHELILDKKIKKTEIIFKNLTDNVSDIIDSVQKNSKPNIENIWSISNNILSEVTDYTYALKAISNEREIDEYLVRHSVNVAVLSSMLGTWLKMQKKEINLLIYSGLLHDIGKTKIPNDILNKPTKLTNNEVIVIKKHPVIAYNILKNIPYLNPNVKTAVLMHHERIDGSGYPLGLKGDKINKFAQIIAIADMYDALTSKRVYNTKFSPFKALEILERENLDKLNPLYLTTFIKKISEYFIGENVKLSNGETAKIIKINPRTIAKPLVQIDDNFIDLNKSLLEIKELHIQ